MSNKHISNLMTPVLLVEHERLENNIRRMATKAESNQVELRPHIKTHKCLEIGMMQLKHGARGITVSTLDEAEIFAEAGFSDITYAVPMAPNKIEAALDIASKTNLRLLVDNHEIVSDLALNTERRGIAIDVLLKVHCGYHRTGVNPRNPASIKIASKISSSRNLTFKGILTHAGHSYNATSPTQIREIAIQEQTEMIEFSKRLESESADLKPEVVSIGSTPTITLTENIMDGITEIRPGNYVFYDYTQVVLGTCQVEDCAVSTIAKVVGKYAEYLVIDSGATALSKDLGPTHLEPETSFGRVYADYEKHELEDSLKIYSLSQEHGKVKFLNPDIAEKYNVGDLVRILPNHSCLTANLHDCYYIVEKDQVVGKWRVRRNRPITSIC